MAKQFLIKNTMADMRNLCACEIAELQDGTYLGVQLLGYYQSGDTPDPINYYLFSTTDADDGGSIVEASTIKLHHDFLGFVNVKYFGAKGNWNSSTQTGADDTVSFQKALDYLNQYKNVRKGQGRCLFIPNGAYLIASLLIPGISVNGENQFGLEISGQSESGTMLFFDHSSTQVGIENREEAVSFRNLTINGSKLFPASLVERKELLVKAYKWSKHTDVDISFKNCTISNYNRFLDIYGRGAIFDNCMLGLGGRLMNIVCSDDMVWDNIDPWGIHSFRTGMRGYIIRNSRIDGASILFSISGSGSQKDYIHGILLSNNNGTGPDRIIDSTDCSLRNPQLLNNDFREAIRNSAVTVPTVYDGVDMGNSWKSGYDPTKSITTDQKAIKSIWECNHIYGLKFSSMANNIRYAVVHAKIFGKHIKIVNSEFPNFLDYKGTGNEGWVVYSPAHIEGLEVCNNIFNSATISGNYYLFNRSAQIVDGKTRINNNITNFNWSGDTRLLYAPKVFVGTAETVGTFTSSGAVTCDDRYVYVNFKISGNLGSGENGGISITLPSINAIPEFGTLSGTYSGGGHINVYAGLKPDLNKQMDGIVVESGSQRALFKTNVINLAQSNLLVSDVNTALTLFGEFKYRWQ